ncbi:MAG: hypothetical protein KC912_07215, partial [Proteobacteria bacterium]|nr:hypothetical protein [Pseudomonadota bacterium]
MSGWLEVGAACAIVSATTSVSPTETGWSEQVVYDLLSSGGCKTVVLHSEPGVQQAPIVGKLRLGDGSGGKLRSERYRTTSSPSGAGLVSVSLPEMLSGDGVRLTVDRSWPADHSYRWQPHRESAAWSELRTWRGAQITSYGEIEVDRKRGTAWVTAATESDSVELPTALPEAYPRDSSQVVVAESGLSLRAALEKVAPLLLQPRAVDGHELVTGDEALARGIVDDRGWARTLVALTKDGPDRVELGHRMPRNAQAGATRDADAELAVYFDGETVRPLMHPVTPDWRGNVQTDGTLQRMEWDQVAPTQPQSALTLNRELNLGWTGDPQYALVPGAGSWVVTVDSIALPADTAAVRYLPLPSDPEEFSFSDGATWTPTLGGVLISAPRGEAREVQVTYRQEDAPTFGERADVAGFSVDQQVRPQDGKVRWEGTSWRLDSADGLPILPNREALLRALDWRFTILAYPEPALPGLLKGRRASWETATDLPEALRSRVTPGDLDVPPLWPRKLLKARRSGVVSSVEAALFTSQWARAMQIDAVWVLVRPAPRGPGPA